MLDDSGLPINPRQSADGFEFRCARFAADREISDAGVEFTARGIVIRNDRQYESIRYATVEEAVGAAEADIRLD